MKCYLILVLLCLSIYIKSDYPSCEQITPTEAEDCKKAVSQKKFCCSLIDLKKSTFNMECKEKSQEEVDQINKSEIKYQCYETQSASSPQTPTSPQDSTSRASSSSFYLEVGVLISIFLLL